MASCEPGAACAVHMAGCQWSSPTVYNLNSFCSCSAEGTYVCTLVEEARIYPCEPDVACLPGEYCQVSTPKCIRSCTCQGGGGTLDCTTTCEPDQCEQGAACNVAGPCSTMTGDCERTCTCDSSGRYDCRVTCPSCPGPDVPTCGDPCDLPGPPGSCVCTREDSCLQGPCFCTALEGEAPRFLCCKGDEKTGQSCAGYPTGYQCGNGSSTRCHCQSDGTWTCGWLD
ncbi:MAG: hypothetical protein EOO75_20500 [Myxococcales bacterium]|nr:MAG: hypothetical protein EOO75_20500 [Myxococcales bacterium]